MLTQDPPPAEGKTAAAPASRPVSSPDHIVSEILRGLYTGRYVPGQRLVEADLTREYKVSRGSIREALKRLAAEGVVSLNLYRGAYIRTLSRSEARDVFAVIEALTGLAARLAAERIREGDNEALMREAVADVVATARGDFIEFAQARNRFYRRLVRVGGNRELDRMLPTMYVHLARTQFRSHGAPEQARRVREYEWIAAALFAADPDAAEETMRDHVRQTAAQIQRLPDEIFAPDDPAAFEQETHRSERLF